MGYEPVPRWKQQLGGALIAAISLSGTAWVWRVALTDRLFYFKASLFLPAMAIIGLALILVPGYKEERIRRGEDLSARTGLALLTPRWWVILGLALAAGIGNHLLLRLI